MSTRTIEFDMLKLYFREPYVIDLPNADGSITVLQPTIGDIVQMGEKKFYTTLNIFTTNTTTYRAPLWKMGIDWNNISDFNLFCMLYQGIDSKVTPLLFENLDFANFKLMSKRMIDSEETEVVLYDTEHKIEINQNVYDHISQYLREMFRMFPENEFTKDAMLKKWWIEKDEREAARAVKDKDKNKNSVLNLISACVNHPGFKYNVQELRDVGVCQFYDSVQRLQIYENATACMKGMYSGFVDGSKIKSEQYNFMRNI